MGKPLAQGSLLSGQQPGRESRVATSRQPFLFGLPPASASWACSQSTPDKCPLSCIPGSLLTHRAAQFSLASIFMVTLAMSRCPVHPPPPGQLPLSWFSYFKEMGPSPGDLFLFPFPRNTCYSSITAFPTSSSPVSILLFPVQCALPT